MTNCSLDGQQRLGSVALCISFPRVRFKIWSRQAAAGGGNGGIDRGHRELLDGRLCRPYSEQRPLVSNFTTVAIVKLCCHNFTQIANFMIFFLFLLFLIDLLTYPY